MSLPDPPPPAPRRQPSLIDVPNEDSARARNAPSMRMLDGLDADGGKTPSKKPAKGHAASGAPSAQAVSGFGATRAEKPPSTPAVRTGWLAATAVALMVLAVLWWWTRMRDATEAAPAEASAVALATPAAVAGPVAAIDAAASASPPTSGPGEAAADAASATATAPAEPARIETVREADVPAAPPLASARAQSGNVTGSQAAASANTAVANASTSTSTATSSSTSTSTSTHAAASPGTPPLTTAAALRHTDTPPPSRVPATSVATNAARKADAPRSVSGDPDVALFDALLARMAGGAKPEPNAAPRPALGDLIERCESRAGKDTPKAATCRPRICADHWGKVDACPAALAPKKD